MFTHRSTESLPYTYRPQNGSELAWTQFMLRTFVSKVNSVKLHPYLVWSNLGRHFDLLVAPGVTLASLLLLYIATTKAQMIPRFSGPAVAAAPLVYFFWSFKDMSTHSAVQSSSSIITLKPVENFQTLRSSLSFRLETSQTAKKRSKNISLSLGRPRLGVKRGLIEMMWSVPQQLKFQTDELTPRFSPLPATIMTCLTGIDHYICAGVVGWKPGQC